MPAFLDAKDNPKCHLLITFNLKAYNNIMQEVFTKV